MAEHLLEPVDLGRPDLAPHESEVGGAGIEPSNRRSIPAKMILELHIGLVFQKFFFPRLK
jgi:hypothetical protein